VPTQLPIQWVLGALSLVVKRLRRGADHSPPSSAEVKMRGAIPPLPTTSSWCGTYISTVTTLLLPINELGARGSIPEGAGILSLPHGIRLWGSPSLLFNRNGGSFPRRQSGRVVKLKLTTHFHLVSTFIKSGVISLFTPYVFVAW